MKARIYLALATLFALAYLVARTTFPYRPILVGGYGALAIGFKYAATRARWKWVD